MDDAGLLAQARRGDAVAFSRLFALFERPIFRYAAHMCGRDAADDIVQDTFLALLRRPNGYDAAKGTVAGYLFGVARHCILKRLSARELATFDVESADDPAGVQCRHDTVLDTLSRAETIQAVRGAIETLPAPYREAVVLCELQEMSYADAAAIAGCPIGTVRSRLHRARSLLLMKLAATGVEVASRR